MTIILLLTCSISSVTLQTYKTEGKYPKVCKSDIKCPEMLLNAIIFACAQINKIVCISKCPRVYFGFNLVVSESLNCFPSSGLYVQYLPHSRKKKKWCCVVLIMFQPGNNFFIENITNSTIYFSKFLDKDFDNGVEFHHDIVLFLHSAILFYHSIS